MVFFVVQYIAAVVSIFILKVFTVFEIEGQENLVEINKPIIISSNHESHLDPQLVGVGLFSRLNLYPLRYMTKNEFFYVPIFNLFVYLLGGFMAYRGRGLQKSLHNPFQILKNNGSVIMFPEGRIIWERGTLGRGKRGTAALAIMTGAGILPMALHTPRPMNPLEFIFSSRASKKIKITIGQVYYLNNVEFPDISDEVTQKGTDLIMKKIAELYNKHKY